MLDGSDLAVCNRYRFALTCGVIGMLGQADLEFSSSSPGSVPSARRSCLALDSVSISTRFRAGLLLCSGFFSAQDGSYFVRV
jgi:hypothetical protein